MRQEVTTPRIYVDNLQFLQSRNLMTPFQTEDDVFRINPAGNQIRMKPLFTNLNEITIENWIDQIWYRLGSLDFVANGADSAAGLTANNVPFGTINYVFLLGTNLAYADNLAVSTGWSDSSIPEIDVQLRSQGDYTSTIQLSDHNLNSKIGAPPSNASIPSGNPSNQERLRKNYNNSFALFTCDDVSYEGIQVALQFKGFTGYLEDGRLERSYIHQDLRYNLIVPSASIGHTYEFPTPPKMRLVQDFETGNIKTKTGYNGRQYSNALWTAPPKWNWFATPWSTAAPVHQYSLKMSSYVKNPLALETWYEQFEVLPPIGRRRWKLTFTQLYTDDVFGSNGMLSKYTGAPNNDSIAEDLGYAEGALDSFGIAFENNIMNDSCFFSNVWHYTNGGQLPFIFQPDKDYYGEDGFAICRVKDGSVKVKRIAQKLFEITLVIEESF